MGCRGDTSRRASVSPEPRLCCQPGPVATSSGMGMLGTARARCWPSNASLPWHLWAKEDGLAGKVRTGTSPGKKGSVPATHRGADGAPLLSLTPGLDSSSVKCNQKNFLANSQPRLNTGPTNWRVSAPVLRAQPELGN